MPPLCDEMSFSTEPRFFCYGEEAIAYLTRRDMRLGSAIERLGFLSRPVNPDMFSALVESIIGQQISTTACKTVVDRLRMFSGDPTTDCYAPELLASLSREQIQSCGITFRKAEYIHDLAERVVACELSFEALRTMSDKDVVRELCTIRGVGVWTAEMLMIHSLQRLDILSFDDLGIQRGMRMLYRHKTIDRERFERYRRRYHPYASVASIYLWAISAGSLPELYDPARGTGHSSRAEIS
jgi:DNA-3-methyladenine glycosylase II